MVKNDSSPNSSSHGSWRCFLHRSNSHRTASCSFSSRGSSRSSSASVRVSAMGNIKRGANASLELDRFRRSNDNNRSNITTTNVRNKKNKRAGLLKVSASLPSVGSAQWLVEQGALSVVAAGAFLFRDRIKALVGGINESPDGETKNFFGLGREDCPTCEGTGYATCACTKWSNDGEGCGACNYTCRTICPSCRGGGKGVRATLDLKIDDEETDRENMRRQRERETHSLKAWNINSSTNSSAAATATAATATAAAVMTTTMNPMTSPLICLPVVSAPESNENGGRRSASSSDNGDGSSNKNKKEPDDEFYAQSGEAIRTLREDYPFFLSKEPRFSIFREDIGLVDATCTFGRNRDPDSLIGGDGGYVMANGLNHYKRVFKVIRTIAAIIFSSCSVKVTRIWSPLSTTGKRTIRVRWSVRGHIRLGAAIGVDVAQFDGISEYKLDKAGYIYEHVITDLDWDVAQLRERVVAMMGAVNKSPSISGQF